MGRIPASAERFDVSDFSFNNDVVARSYTQPVIVLARHGANEMQLDVLPHAQAIARGLGAPAVYAVVNTDRSPNSAAWMRANGYRDVGLVYAGSVIPLGPSSLPGPAAYAPPPLGLPVAAPPSGHGSVGGGYRDGAIIGTHVPFPPQRSWRWLWWVPALLVLGVVGLVGWGFWSQYQLSERAKEYSLRLDDLPSSWSVAQDEDPTEPTTPQQAAAERQIEEASERIEGCIDADPSVAVSAGGYEWESTAFYAIIGSETWAFDSASAASAAERELTSSAGRTCFIDFAEALLRSALPRASDVDVEEYEVPFDESAVAGLPVQVVAASAGPTYASDGAAIVLFYVIDRDDEMVTQYLAVMVFGPDYSDDAAEYVASSLDEGVRSVRQRIAESAG